MNSIIECALLRDEWHARTNPNLANMIPSVDWIPHVIFSSWERNEAFCFTNALIQYLTIHSIPEPIDCIWILQHPLLSLEQNEFGQWEITDHGKTILMRFWFQTAPFHMIETLLEWTKAQKRTFEEFHDLATDIMSRGINLFSCFNSAWARSFVDAMRPRAKHSTKMLHFFLRHFQKSPLVFIDSFKDYSPQLFANFFAARPDWFHMPDAYPIVESIILWCMEHNNYATINQLQLLLGLNRNAAYWPDNGLVDVMEDQSLEIDCTATNGIYMIDPIQITLERYVLCQEGQQLLKPFGLKIFRQLLGQPIEVLSAWSAEYDNQDVGSSLRDVILRYLPMMDHHWANYYKMTRHAREHWLKVALNMAHTVSQKLKHAWENWILMIVFDKAQVVDDPVSEKTAFSSTTASLIQPLTGNVGPRMMVALFSALIQECEDASFAEEWMRSTSSMVDWKQALIAFSDQEWDRWSYVKSNLHYIRWRIKEEERCMQMAPPCIVPQPHKGCTTSSFPWLFATRQHQFAMVPTQRILSLQYSSIMYGYRTLEQSIQKAKRFVGLPDSPTSTSCPYVKGRGMHSRWFGWNQALLKVGERVLATIRVKCTGAYFIRCPDLHARRVAYKAPAFAMEVALAAMSSRHAMCESLLELGPFGSFVWHNYTQTNKIKINQGSEVTMVPAPNTKYKAFEDVMHGMLLSIWVDQENHTLVQWSMVDPFEEVAPGDVPKISSDLETWQKAFSTRKNDSFCGPAISAKHLPAYKFNLIPLVPIAWNARGHYCNHQVRLEFLASE